MELIQTPAVAHMMGNIRLIMLMLVHMSDNGKIINHMVKVLKLGQIQLVRKINMKASFGTVNQMAKEHIPTVMGKNMKVNGKMEIISKWVL